MIILLSSLGIYCLQNSRSILETFNQKTEADIYGSRAFETTQKITENSTGIPSYEIQLNSEDLRGIEDYVKHIRRQGYLGKRDRKWFKAKLVEGEDTYKGKVRIRGNLPSHWSTEKRSWRFKFKKDKFFHGYRELNFNVPFDKGLESQQLSNDLGRALGVLTHESGFARLGINGVNMGLYVWHEQHGPEMLERLKYPMGEIFSASNVITETLKTPYGIPLAPLYQPTEGKRREENSLSLFPAYYDTTIHDEPLNAQYISRWHELLELIKESSDEEFQKNISNYLNLQKYYLWNAITWRFGSMHAHWGNNLRWYYDNTTGLFEPILYDVYHYPIEDARDGTFEGLETDPLAKRLFRIPEHQQKRNKILWQLANDKPFSLIDRGEYYFKLIRPYLLTGIRSRLPSEVDSYHNKTMTILRRNATTLIGHLSFLRAFSAPALTFQSEDSKNTSLPTLSAKIIPDSLNNVNINSLSIKGEITKIGATETLIYLVSPTGEKKQVEEFKIQKSKRSLNFLFSNLQIYTPRDSQLIPRAHQWTLEIVFPKIKESSWLSSGYITEAKFNYSNSITNKVIEPHLNYQMPLALFLEETKDKQINPINNTEDLLRELNNSAKINGNELIFPSGTHLITRSIVLPREVRITLQAGATLKLAPNVSIVSYQPLHAIGSPAQPIRIERLDPARAWGSFAIISAPSRSNAKHIIVSGGNESHISGLFLSGQFCFYSSDITLNNCTIENASADDGLNIKSSRIDISNCIFQNNASDAFDGDWVQGIIRDSYFTDNLGDGIDLSGSKILALQNILSNMEDKAASIGENSQVLFYGNTISNSKIGIAVKDLSNLDLYSGSFYNNQTAIELYRKKQLFGGSTAEITGTVFWKNHEDFNLDKESILTAKSIASESTSIKRGVSISDHRKYPDAPSNIY